MADFQNTFSWSHSRHRLFRRCRRQYYWNYYGSWGGWRAVAPKEARLAYRLKQIVTLKMWAGDIVHRAIERYLRALRAGQSPTPDEVREDARRMMNTEWSQSIKKHWERDPKGSRNLFEHYYGQPIEKEERDALRERVFNCIQGFFDSESAGQVRQAGPERWLALEDLQQFEVMRHPVWVKIDVAAAIGADSKDSDALIVDWKTGNPSDDDRAQTMTYTLYAMKAWGRPPDRIEGRMVYLRDGTETPMTFSAEDLIDHRESIMESMRAMQDQLRDPRANEAAFDDFPMTDEQYKCRQCNFFHLCFETREMV